MRWSTGFLLVVTVFIACQDDRSSSHSDEPARFSLLTPQQSGVTFTNTVTETPEFHHLLWESVFYGGGVAVGDLNNDGLPDLYFTGNQVDDALYLNQGNMEFADVSDQAGIRAPGTWSTGVTMADVNADGWLDIYVCKSWWDLDANHVDGRRNRLLINNGDLTFTDRAAEYGLDDAAYSTQATFFDYDLDGDLDMYLMNAPSNNFRQKLRYMADGHIPYLFSDKLYENEGGKFTDRTRAAGVENYAFGLGLVATDLNADGWPDLYVACDYEQPDKIFVNNQDGTFTDRLQYLLKHTSYSSMGCDISDINNDALPDIAVLDMQASDHVRAKTNMPAMSSATFWQNVQKGYGYQYMSNVLQLNNGYGFFSEIGQLAGIAKTDWSWSVLLADFDHDRLNDMYVTNGVNRDMRNSDLVEQMEQVPPSRRAATDLFELAKTFPSQAIPNHLFQNQGDLTFADVTDHWGLAYPGFSFGAAYGDLDGDGDLDLVTCNANDVAHIFRNDTPPRHYLQIVLRGSADNPFALGATARIFDKMGSQIRSLTLTRGYQSSVEPLLHFGLGEVELVDSLHVVFPDGRTYQTYNIRADQRLEISHADARVRGLQLPADRPVTFSNMTDSLGLRFLHRENRFNDFTRETLLPHMQSRNGPFIATGDLNGDGHADFFIGGAAGQPGQIFLQQADGTFRPERVADLAADAAFEDMGSVIADLNGDGANDLFVVSGGNEYPEGSPAYQDRLYLNDGRGHLARAPARLPRIATNGSCVRARDFEGDGDTDLFVGHRGIPGAYPRAGGSLLLVNQNGVFVDQTEMLAPALVNAGMVTDAAWSDVDSDGDADLLVVGEWMSPQVFVQESGRWFQQTGHVLAEDLTGWWFSIKTMDIDRDGDDDYILGNMGLNNKYHPTPERPLNIYARDFDGNNTNDIVLARLTQYGEVPVRGRECSSEQMPFIADKFPDYQSFARATLQDIYGDALSGSVRIQAREFRSGVLINDPPGRLTFMPFPNQAQIAPVQAAIEVELNGDGHPDLLLAGNHFDAEVETVRHDASNGLVLLGNGDGTFEPLAVWQTLFYVPFNTKDMALLRTATGRPVVLTANNNFQLMAFSYQ